MSFYGGSRLPFARLQNSPKLPKRFPAAPRRHSGRGDPFLQLQQVPEAVAMSFYGGSRLPFASLHNSQGSVWGVLASFEAWQTAALNRHKRTLPRLQGLVGAAGKVHRSLSGAWELPKLPKRFPAAPRRHSGRGEPFLQLQQVPEAVAMFFYGGSRLPFARLQNSPKLPKRFPAAPRRHSGCGEPFLQLQQVPEAVAMSFYGGSRLPFARLQNSPKLPKRFPAAPRRHSGRGEPFLQLQQVPEAVFKTRQNSPNASLQLPGATQAAVNLSCSSNKSSLQNSPKLSKRFPAAPRRHSGRGEPFLQLQQVSKPWQCPFMEVQGCRLPGFKTRQNSPNASLQLPGATQAAVNLSCSSNKSLRPWQCPFKEVQGCRLPGFKTRQNSPNASLQLPGATQAAVNLSCSSTSP